MAERSTSESVGNTAVQSVPQSIPAGVLITVPAPLPDFSTVRSEKSGPIKYGDLENDPFSPKLIGVPTVITPIFDT